MILNKYSIKDLEVLSGVKAHTIRIWEKRYGLLAPQRTTTNIRYYTDDDLRKIINVSLLIRNGHKISRIAVWDSARLQNEVMNLEQSSLPDHECADQMISAIINFDLRTFDRLVSEYIDKHGLEEAYQKVFFKFLEKLGVYWHAGAIYPAQEHFVFSFLRQKIISEINKLGIAGESSRTILFFLPEREMHEMSLLFYSYLARKKNLNVIYLGAMVPFEDLEKITSSVQFDQVFTAFVNPLPVEELKEYLTKLKLVFSGKEVFITGLQVQNLSQKELSGFTVIQNYQDFLKSFRNI